MIIVTNVAKCRGEMAHIIGRLNVYILQTQITTRLNAILNSDWLHALTHFSSNSGVCLLNQLRMTPSIMAPLFLVGMH
ncbi:hypothetical protein BLOT_012539 [Blomia tropicalis]|nr:hypothetical protein BLOT_012539 [Blomia tropicalis]